MVSYYLWNNIQSRYVPCSDIMLSTSMLSSLMRDTDKLAVEGWSTEVENCLFHPLLFFFFPTWGFRPSHANIFPLEPVNSYHDLNNYSMVFTWLILHGFYLTCSHTLNNNFLSKSPPRLHRPAVPKQGLGLQTVKNLSIIHPKNSSYEIVETAKSFWV